MTNFQKIKAEIKAEINAMTTDDFIDNYLTCADVPFKHKHCIHKTYGEYNCRACKLDYLKAEVEE